jgi:hypothetical protein
MDDNALPCRPLNDALVNIYNAVIRQWDNKYNELSAKKNTEAESEAESDAESEALSESSANVENSGQTNIVNLLQFRPMPSSPTIEHVTEEHVTEEITMTEEQPTVTEEQPTVIEEQPTVIEEQPTVIEEQPTVIEEQPTVIEEQPTVTEEVTLMHPTKSFTTSYNNNTMIITDGEIVTKFPYFTDHAYITKDFINETKQALSEDRFRKWLKAFAILQQTA